MLLITELRLKIILFLPCSSKQGRVSLIILSAKDFLTVDDFNGVQIYNMEGRIISNGKKYNLHRQLLSRQSISLSPTVLAAIDRSSPSQVRMFDVATGWKAASRTRPVSLVSQTARCSISSLIHLIIVFDHFYRYTNRESSTAYDRNQGDRIEPSRRCEIGHAGFC